MKLEFVLALTFVFVFYFLTFLLGIIVTGCQVSDSLLLPICANEMNTTLQRRVMCHVKLLLYPSP